MTRSVDELLTEMVSRKASDLHITVGVPPAIRINGTLIKLDDSPLSPADTKTYVSQLVGEEKRELLQQNDEIDMCISRVELGRFRLNVYKQRGSYAAAIRHVNSVIPEMEQLGLPPFVKEVINKTRGLFLVTGPTGSGKSTTLASMISEINKQRASHVITLEDPIEYLHRHNKSIINQREIGNDSNSYSDALRAALREDPDVILIGEMRDYETMSIALSAAETGHLVFSTLHTVGAPKTVDRIIDVFPPNQQNQVKAQLSTILIGLMSQILLPKKDLSGRVAAFEVMVANSAVRNLIREGKTHQIYSIMQTAQREGMITLDQSLIELCRTGKIDSEDALSYATDREYVARTIGSY